MAQISRKDGRCSDHTRPGAGNLGRGHAQAVVVGHVSPYFARSPWQFRGSDLMAEMPEFCKTAGRRNDGTLERTLRQSVQWSTEMNSVVLVRVSSILASTAWDV